LRKIPVAVPSLVLLLCATLCVSASFAGGDFLRVSITCPVQPGNGVLETIDEGPKGNQSKVSYFYNNGRMEKVAVSSSEDGTVFKEVFALERVASEATNEAPAFQAYEDGSKELFRFYCFAEPYAKERYLELLRDNRDMLRRLKGG
jgi:hypothetical protein